MTDSEQLLWSKLRRKQLLGIQFYRQKPIGVFIVDFYAPKVKLVIEVDGSQHFTDDHITKDLKRDSYLMEHGLRILRFNNLEVLKNTEAVLEVILKAINKSQIPPAPLC